MKRFFHTAAVIFLTVMLSACGKQSGEALDGQTENFELKEQAETPEMAVDEDVTGNRETKESSPAAGERMAIQEGSNSMTNDITFDFESKTVMLNSGYEMPIYGLGTYSLTGQTCVASVTAALNSGVRLIDTAYMYHNEESVGEAVRNSGIPREDIFVITKLYPSQFSNPETAIEEAIAKLDIGYIDARVIIGTS